MKTCKVCKLEYDNNLTECPWCKTNIGLFQSKIAKKNEIEGNFFKIIIAAFIIGFIYNMIEKAFPMYILWIGLGIYIIIELIADSIICNKLEEEKKKLLTLEEQKKLKNYHDKKIGNFPKLLTNGTYLSGISKFSGEERCVITCTDEKICFEMKSSKKKVNLPYNHILEVGKQTKNELITTYKNRNVIARGITGGLLFGTTGAILGGLSGVAPKIENMPINTNFLCIKYRTQENKEDVIIIEMDNVNQILKFLNTKLGNREKEIDL